MSVSELHPVALGTTTSILLAIPSLLVGVTAPLVLNGKPIAIAVGSVYTTYIPTLTAGILGAIGFGIAGYFAGFAGAILYNRLIAQH